MYLICDGLARLLAPILPVTADELWRHLPGARARHRCTSRSFRRSTGSSIADLLGDVGAPARACASEVNAALEQKRKDKVIGNSLGARVDRHRRAVRSAALLEQHRADLPMLFIVSDVELHVGLDRRRGRGAVSTSRRRRA